MTGTGHKGYSLVRDGDTLVFTTGRFREGQGSVLHRGLYNPELASILSAGSVLTCIALLFVMRKHGDLLPAYLFSLLGAISFLVAFIVLFLFFRIVVFREKSLVAAFDRQSGEAAIQAPGFFVKKKFLSAFSAYKISLLKPGGLQPKILMLLSLSKKSLPSTGQLYRALERKRPYIFSSSSWQTGPRG